MKTSKKGIEFLERHEGVVLKAYRDPVGILTIGAGLTKASGVIDPKPGMTITKTQASKYLARALAQNYEPTVAREMPNANQHEADGGISFHYNTGAITRASWVAAWAAGDFAELRRRIGLWKKGGGRVLPGLVRRRSEEADLIIRGTYGDPVFLSKLPLEFARITLKLSSEEFASLRDGLDKLGFAPGSKQGAILKSAVTDFQRAHDLTPDGIIGRATLSTLQRMIDARTKTRAPTVLTGTSTAGGTAGAVDPTTLPIPPEYLWIGAGLGLVWLVWLGWQYRDAAAAKLQNRAPKLAKKLRSV